MFIHIVKKFNKRNNTVPILFNNENECCGCSACYSICPKAAIVMIVDYKGFWYPKIKQEMCVGCEQCIRVCPLK